MVYSEGFNTNEQANNMLATLASITSLYNDKYLTLRSSLGTFSPQRAQLQESIAELDKKIKLKNSTISTYEREFLDRKALENPFTFWRLRGVSTLQDWVLFIFFAVYGILCITALALTFLSQYPLYNFLVVLLSSFTIGIMITATIVRFA
jgi:hypothetical protein